MTPLLELEERLAPPRDVLQAGLRTWYRRPVRIVAMESQPLETRSTYPIERLLVRLDSDELLPVIFKRLQPVAGERKGDRHEVLVYRRLLAGQRFGAPALYASCYDERAGRYWLFLEDVGEQTLERADHATWQAAVRWLAGLHGAYLGREAELRAVGCLIEHDLAYYQTIAARARRHLHQAGNRPALGRLDALERRLPALVDALIRPPGTLLHGDIFPWNLLVQDGDRIRPIDWEAAAIGPPAWDLARLLDGWGADKPAFIEQYLAELGRVSGQPIDRRFFQDTFARAEILKALLHLAWSPEACTDAAFVDGRLGKMETGWQQLERTPGHG